jgi:hypothetical protein
MRSASTRALFLTWLAVGFASPACSAGSGGDGGRDASLPDAGPGEAGTRDGGGVDLGDADLGSADLGIVDLGLDGPRCVDSGAYRSCWCPAGSGPAFTLACATYPDDDTCHAYRDTCVDDGFAACNPGNFASFIRLEARCRAYCARGGEPDEVRGFCEPLRADAGS